MIKISDIISQRFPNLEYELRVAQMKPNPKYFITICLVFSLVFGLILGGAIFFLFYLLGYWVVGLIAMLVVMVLLFFVSLMIPKFNINNIRKKIENDIFFPSRMLLTLLESGSSIVSALVEVSYTKTESSKYFGKIASEIYLGKPLEESINDAIHYTPSESFRRVLEPIKKSLLTGTDINRNLDSTLKEITREKIIEIEEYGKKLNPISMFYLIFGTIMPAVGVIVLVIGVSVIGGYDVKFWPYLFVVVIAISVIQIFFLRVFSDLRPTVKL